MPTDSFAVSSSSAEQTLFYRGTTTRNMWDTWLFEYTGVHYLFYLVGPGGQWYGIAMASSHDGVHWREHGLVIEKTAGAAWLGTGTVWQVADAGGAPRFLLNFSEWRGAGQTIFFAESQDLLTWRRLGRSTEFVPDGRWYRTDGGNDGRWDCIYTIPRTGGGLYGFWTANPHQAVGFGFGESDDGQAWRALPPPRIDWDQMQPMPSMESGAVAAINGRYYTMIGCPTLYREHPCGMYTFVAERPEGPYAPAATNYEVLTSSGNRCHTYFARFYPTAHGLLVNHHAVSCTGEVFFAPLKGTEVDADQVLRLTWWPGNDHALARWNDVHRAHVTPIGASTQCEFPAERGFYLEGRMVLADLGSTPATVHLHCTDGNGGIRFILHRTAMVAIEVVFEDGRVEKIEQIDRHLSPGAAVQMRLLVMQGFVELYLDKYLIQVHAMHAPAAGRLTLQGVHLETCLVE